MRKFLGQRYGKNNDASNWVRLDWIIGHDATDSDAAQIQDLISNFSQFTVSDIKDYMNVHRRCMLAAMERRDAEIVREKAAAAGLALHISDRPFNADYVRDVLELKPAFAALEAAIKLDVIFFPSFEPEVAIRIVEAKGVWSINVATLNTSISFTHFCTPLIQFRDQWSGPTRLSVERQLISKNNIPLLRQRIVDFVDRPRDVAGDGSFEIHADGAKLHIQLESEYGQGIWNDHVAEARKLPGVVGLVEVVIRIGGRQMKSNDSDRAIRNVWSNFLGSNP